MAIGVDALKRSPLHDRHVAAGARMVPFAGWEMPVQYEGIRAEHVTVRRRAGVFDVSHMGEIETTGPDAEARYPTWPASYRTSPTARPSWSPGSITTRPWSVTCPPTGTTASTRATARHGSARSRAEWHASRTTHAMRPHHDPLRRPDA